MVHNKLWVMILKKISRVSLFFFIFNYYYLFLRIFLFPYLYKEYGVSAYMIILLIILVTIIFLLIIPKRIYKMNTGNKVQKSVFKYIYNILILIRVGVTIYVTSLILHDNFFTGNNNILLAFGLVIGIICVSKLLNHEIIDISTFFYMFGLLVTLLSFFDIIELDFSLLKSSNLKMPDISFYYILFSYLADLVILVVTNEEKKDFNKINLIIPIVFSFILVFIEYYLLILVCGDTLFKDYISIGFLSLSIQKVSVLVGNVSFLYMYLIIISTVFKESYLLSSFRINNKRLFSILEGICLFGIIIILNQLQVSLNVGLKILMYILLGGYIIVPWFIKEIVNARKFKEM